jgi:phospholipase D1/2
MISRFEGWSIILFGSDSKALCRLPFSRKVKAGTQRGGVQGSRTGAVCCASHLRRWDTCDHRPDDERRKADDTPYPPFHDLDVAEERVATEIDAQGSMSATIDRLGSPQRTLKRLENFGVSETVVSLASIADPEQPVTIENLVAQFAPRTEIRMRGVRWLTFATAVVALTALAALWQFTPVADVITPGRVTHWAREFAGNVWAPLIVLAAYTPAAMVMFPRPLITLFAVVAFGPWLGFGYAMSGILISAFVTYVIGMRMDRGTVRRLAGPKLNRIIAVLRRRGIVALTALRLVPLAPFAIVGVVAGAIRVKLRDFMLATAFGMLPGTLAAAVFGDHLEVALRDPSEVNLWLVAAVLMALGIATLLVRRWLLTTQLHGESTRA